MKCPKNTENACAWDRGSRSPDLNPLDYSSRVCLKQKSIEYSGIWGKSRLFSPRPQTLLQLKVRLDQEIARLAVIEKETQIPK